MPQRALARGTGPIHPNNLTGRIAQETKAKAEAAKAAKNVDIEAVRQDAYRDGWSVGWDRGWKSALEGIYDMYKQGGVKALEGIMAELDASTEETN